MITPKIETDDFLLSITKNCETLIKQTLTRPQQTLEFKLTQPKQTFSSTPSINLGLDCNWMLRLKKIEVSNAIFNITEEKNKFELYTDNFDELSFEELKDELEDFPNISGITPYHLQHEKIGPRIISAYKNLRLEKPSTDGYIILLLGYARSPFRAFESYLRIVLGLDEDDVHLGSKQYNPNFFTYEISPGIYSIILFSEAGYTMGDHKGTLKIEFDDIIMETKLILTRFGGTFGTLRFDEKSFFGTLLGLTPYWDYKPTNAIHADSPGVYTSDKILKLSTTDKIHLKTNVIEGSIVSDSRQTILYSFVLDKPAG